MENALEQEHSTEFGFVKDGKVYLKAYDRFETRQIGEVKTTPEDALAYFIKRFAFITGKVDQLLQDIEQAQNKGSYLMKLLHMRTQLESYEALGDFMPLFAKLDKAEESIRELIDVNRVKNLEIKRALLQEWNDNLLEITDWVTASAKAKEIREKWLKTGSVAEAHEAEIEGQFEELLNKFYTERKVYFDERQRIMMERVDKYAAIVERAKELILPDVNPFHAFKTMGILTQEWKVVGPVPKVHFEPLIQELKAVKRQVTFNLKRAKNDKSKKQRIDPVLIENLAKKEAMIEEVRSYEQIDLRIAFKKTKDMQNAWRDVGNVPEHMKNDINSKFTYHCDRIFELSYLMRTVYIQNRFFNTKPLKDQLKLKVQLMREIIKKDEEELQGMESEFNALSESEKRNPNNKPLFNKLNTQRRKLRVKHKLMSEMEAQLLELV